MSAGTKLDFLHLAPFWHGCPVVVQGKPRGRAHLEHPWRHPQWWSYCPGTTCPLAQQLGICTKVPPTQKELVTDKSVRARGESSSCHTWPGRTGHGVSIGCPPGPRASQNNRYFRGKWTKKPKRAIKVIHFQSGLTAEKRHWKKLRIKNGVD